MFIILFFLVLADPALSQPQTPILGGAKERQPGYGQMENFTIFLTSSLLVGMSCWFRVSKDGKYAYVSNYQGFSIVDVSDPSKPRVISKVKNDPSVQSQYIDVSGKHLSHKRRRSSRREDQSLGRRHSTLRYQRPGKACARWVFSKPTWHPAAVFMASGSTRIRNKENSHSSLPPRKVTTTTF